MTPDAFAGWVRFDGAAPGAPAEDRLRRAVGGARVAFRRAEGAVLAQSLQTGRAGGGDPCAPGGGGAPFAAVARLDNREELGEALEIRPAALAGLSDASLVARMLGRWGDSGVGRCLGRFAFALWEPRARRLTLGRDCMGEAGLFFYRGPGFVDFATSLVALLALPDTPRALDEAVLGDYLALNLREARRTFYRGVERVPSRTLVTIEAAGARHRHYWSPDLDGPAPYRREADYVERARELLDQAVASATRYTPRVAIATSGGLDSSAVAATAARQERAVTSYALVAPAGLSVDFGPFKYPDERTKLEALRRQHPTLDLRFLAPETAHPLEADDTRIFARAQVPVLNPTGVGTFSFLYDAVAADGHRRLQMAFMGNFGLTWPGPGSLTALLRQGRVAGFVGELAQLARETRRSLPRTLASEVVLRGAPPPLRRAILRLAGRDPLGVARFSALNPAFVTGAVAAHWRAEGFDPWFTLGGGRTDRLRAYYLFDYNQFARDAQAASLERRGFEIADPLADRRLLEFVLKVPEPMFRRGGVARSFARRVLADRLPREILDERRTGMQDPNWFQRLGLRRAEIGAQIERLEGSATVRRLVDLPRLKRLMAEWPADAQDAEARKGDFHVALTRAVHVGNFIRWVEGATAEPRARQTKQAISANWRAMG